MRYSLALPAITTLVSLPSTVQVIWSVAATEYDALLRAGVSVDVKIEYREITSVPRVKSAITVKVIVPTGPTEYAAVTSPESKENSSAPSPPDNVAGVVPLL